jgi:3-deoxy-D-manno-octulosonic-acid transferase
LEQLKSSYPQHKILLTFFSPSGYEIHKNYASANWIFYLPMDNEKNATQFFNIVQPQLILFVKYDFWYYYLQQAQQRKIPLLLISGVFRPNQPFFKWYGSFHKSMLHCFTHFFVQNEESKNLLHSIGIEKNVSVGGDTRFDRVLEIAGQEINIELIEKFAGNQPLIVAGSIT